MALTVQKIEPSRERMVLVGMLVHTPFLSAAATHWREPGLFASKWVNLLGGWAVEHYKAHGHAPKKAIIAYYERWAAQNNDPDTTRLIGSLLLGMSDEYKILKDTFTPDHLLDIADRLFERVRLQRAAKDATQALANGDVDRARRSFENARRVKIGEVAGLDLFASRDAFKRALNFRSNR